MRVHRDSEKNAMVPRPRITKQPHRLLVGRHGGPELLSSPSSDKLCVCVCMCVRTFMRSCFDSWWVYYGVAGRRRAGLYSPRAYAVATLGEERWRVMSVMSLSGERVLLAALPTGGADLPSRWPP